MILSRHIIDLIGWTLIHFLWQGAAVAALYALASGAIPRRSANARYLTSCAALLLLTCCPVITLGMLSLSGETLTPGPVAVKTIDLPSPAERAPNAEWPLRLPARPLTGRADAASISVYQTGLERLDDALPWLALAWLIGVLALSIRLLLGWIEVGRIRSHARRLPDHPLKQALDEMKTRLGIERPVNLAESDRVDVPAIIGWLKPMALIPVGALLWMGSEELEALIAHELAHVRRCDYVVNLAQSLVETLLFYHPAVWWISGRIRSEREACCDDLAVATVGNPVVYARALAALAEITSPRQSLALAASGGSVINRIRRVLGKAEHEREPLSGWIAGALAATILLAAAVPFHQPSSRRTPGVAIRTLIRKPLAAMRRYPRRSTVTLRPAPGLPAIQVLAPSSSLRREESLRKDPTMPHASPRFRVATWPALAPLVLSLASPGSSPALASPHPAPSSPAHQPTAPVHNAAMIGEMIPLRYIDGRLAVSRLEDAVGPEPWMAEFRANPKLHGTAPGSLGIEKQAKQSDPNALPPILARIFPAGTELIPYRPQNALIVVSSPDGVALLKEMLKPVDVKQRSILFQMEEGVAPAEELRSEGIDPALPTSSMAQPGPNCVILVGDHVADYKKIIESGPGNVTGRPRFILPSGMMGITDPSMAPINVLKGGVSGPALLSSRITIVGLMNSDGSITVYARIEKYNEHSHSDGSAPITLPGLRIANGDTVGVVTRLGNASKDQRCLVYFITPNLVDDHGQIAPGGADAVRKAWQEDHQE